MEKNRPRGREKHVSGQSATLSKKDNPTNVGGPVGNTHGYSGRPGNDKIPFSGNRPNSGYTPGGNGPNSGHTPGGNRTVRRAGGGFGTIAILIVAYLLFSGRCGGNVSDVLTNVAGQISDYGQQTVQETYVPQQPAATPRPASKPTVAPTVSNSFAGVSAPSAASTAVSGKAREKYTTIRGRGQDTVTIMVYMCGTDLESNYGMATNDLNEMLRGKVSDKVKLIIETGGCRKWQNSVMSNSTNQRYQITSEGLVRLDDSVGKKRMTDASTLASFISFCKKNYPADRYALIMWDHGGGSVAGYGHDELFTSAGSMRLDQFGTALKQAGCKFDFIGFDACLMATLETCLTCEPYADYLIASEETEPGVGWYYTDWLASLSQNTSVPTVELGKEIIDGFVTECARKSPSDKTTLSIVDLAEFSATVPPALRDFAVSTTSESSSDIRKISTAREQSREFSAQSRLDQVDLIDFAQRIGTPESIALANALKDAVKYNRTSRSMTNANGVSIYFPCKKLSNVSNALTVYDGIGMDQEYAACVRSFASMMAGGQIPGSVTGTSGYGSLFGSLLGDSGSGSGFGSLLGGMLGGSSGGSDIGSLLGGVLGGTSGGSSSSGYGSFDAGSLIGSLIGGGGSGIDLSSLLGGRGIGDASWVDTELIANNADKIAANVLMPDDLMIRNVKGHKVVAMSEDKWQQVSSVALNVFFDDGKGGYIDLGLDNVLEYDEDGNLLCEYDGMWLALDGHIVPYYLIDESYEEGGDGYCIRGYVPAFLTGSRRSVDSDETVRIENQLVQVMIIFDNDHPRGRVVGVRPAYDGETETVAKGGIPLEKGDVLSFVCDYYDKDGRFSSNHVLNDPLTVNGEIEIDNVTVKGGRLIASYRFTDIYNNEYWTNTF